mgnify:CR=1 FL=1
MFHIVLVEPEIPPNTGNVIRLAANTGCALHLIEPLGFSMEDRLLQRAGLDYHEYTRLKRHADWAAFLAAVQPARCFAFTTRATRLHTEVDWRPGDVLVFGSESAGLPDDHQPLAKVGAGATDRWLGSRIWVFAPQGLLRFRLQYAPSQ